MNKFKRIFFSVIIVVFFLLVAFLTYNLAEPKSYDFMIKHFLTKRMPFDTQKQIYGSDDIVLVVIDAKTVERYRWPWKREAYCPIFNYLNYSKPKIIIHDAIITTLDKENPDSDKKFFNTVKNTDNLIVGFMPRFQSWENPQDGERIDKIFEQKFGLKVIDNTSVTPDLYESFMAFPQEYLKVVKNVGSVSMLPGFINGNVSDWAVDEIYRTHEYIFQYKDTHYPSFALKTYLMLNNNPQIVLTNKKLSFPDKNYDIGQTKTYYQTVTPMRYYNLYNTGYSHKSYSALDIIDSYNAVKVGRKPTISPDTFKDKIVLIGANVPAGTGLNDNKNTPISVNHPGVDIQATAIDNIIHNDFLKVIPQSINFIITLFCMLILYGLIRACSLFKSVLSMVLISLIYLIISGICFYFGVVINVLTPIVMFVLTTILAYTHKFISENRSKEKVKFAMGKYMSQDVMQRVVQDIDNLGLGGKKAVVTVLFSDIRGFTSMSEQMPAQQVSEILNEYFTEMEPIITQYNGIINKFIGDAVMAVFGEPIQDDNHSQNAVKCAYAMLKRVKELREKWENEGKPKIEIGIGINTGEVFVGNIGSINRMEYTVIGDTVNLASRLESYNKVYKTKILISQSTYNEVKNIVDVIKIPEVQIRGKANKIDIYEVLKVAL